MISLSSKPKFFLLNAIRALSLISLLFIFIANCLILAEDVKAIHTSAHDKDLESCDYVENSGVPNQPAGEFRAIFSLSLNLLQTIIFFLAEIEFPKVFFQHWIPCLYNESLVALGVLEVLLAAQMMSHFLEAFPLVACFFLLVAGIMNILTMYMDEPKSSRSWGAWRRMRNGTSPSSAYERGLGRPSAPFSAAPSHESFNEKRIGFGRNGTPDSLRQPLPVVSRHVSVSSHGTNESAMPPRY